MSTKELVNATPVYIYIYIYIYISISRNILKTSIVDVLNHRKGKLVYTKNV